MDNRDHILISWPARDIEGTIFPVIQELSERFNIIVIVLSTSNSDLMKTKLDSNIVMNSLLSPIYSSRGIVESKQDFGIDEMFSELNNNSISIK